MGSNNLNSIITVHIHGEGGGGGGKGLVEAIGVKGGRIER